MTLELHERNGHAGALVEAILRDRQVRIDEDLFRAARRRAAHPQGWPSLPFAQVATYPYPPDGRMRPVVSYTQ